MAAPGTPYNKARMRLAQGQINLATADVRALLVTSSYTPNLSTHEFVSSVTSAEVTTNGAARVALANKSITQDDANNRAKFTCDAVEFGPASGGSITARRMILFIHTGNDATAPLVGHVLLDDTAGGTDVVAAAGQKIRYTPHANGLIQI
jgi:hypothetical protein